MIHMTDDEFVTTARGIVTGELIPADLSKQEWRLSLALILSHLDEEDAKRIGLILVPKSAHAHGYWVNGTAPGVTLRCQTVHRDDIERLDREVQRMAAALWPEGEPDGPGTERG